MAIALNRPVSEHSKVTYKRWNPQLDKQTTLWISFPTSTFEKQEGNLCLQHALNALLQGPYFTAVDLAEIAGKLDEDEQDVVAPREQPRESANYDDSGFFSIQGPPYPPVRFRPRTPPQKRPPSVPKPPSKRATVHSKFPYFLTRPLVTYEALFASIHSPVTQHPRDELAFICNLQEHWYTLRRFALPSRWYNLNSMLDGAEWISETYLGMMLRQIESEGYSIFVIRGTSPTSPADDLAATLPPPPKSRASNTLAGQGYTLSGTPEQPIAGLEDDDWARSNRG
ncbi:Josephin-domain-containing protein [Jimgerdemannia flammicorona]|uniref:Ataxin-3 homolog n=1 Tax=Jimgerdemannia flammicorona TaxID=994334 RepID=A0A433QRM3_9FUNG|nr:Josephin-domain-containing protein [Jimgerdemannia flammicorona]